MNTQDYLSLVTRVLGSAIALSSAQWIAAVTRFRLGLLFGWGPRKRRFVLLFLIVRFVAGVCLLILPEQTAILTICLLAVFVSNMVVWRFMQPILTAVFRMIHILTFLLIVGHADDGQLAAFALGLVAATSILSYVVTGITKLLSSGWHYGDTLLLILNSRTNGCNSLYQWLARRKILLVMLARGVILFECLSPLLLLMGPPGAIAFCILAATFHLTLAFVMGMNLFPLTWGATYPAIIFASLNMERILHFPDKEFPIVWVLMAWFGILVAWQFVAWIPRIKSKNKYAFYFMFYEFYMFAIRHPDAGVRYRRIDDSAETLHTDMSLPLPWKRRLVDGFWNPEHELKKALRYLCNEIRFSNSRVWHLKRVEIWLRNVGNFPKEVKFQFRIVEEDTFERADAENIARAEIFR